MIEFRSLKEAIEYRTHCPLCENRMVIDGTYGVDTRTEYTWDFREKTIVTWLRPNEEVTIDVDTEVVKTVFREMPQPVYGANFYGSAATYSNTPIVDGLLYVRLGIGCEDCCQYSYTIRVLVDMSHPKIVSLPLNSETITLVDDALTHEIRNIYTTNETEYTYFRSYMPAEDPATSSGPITFPLVPLDLSNPRKTLNRIRSLIVFS